MSAQPVPSSVAGGGAAGGAGLKASSISRSASLKRSPSAAKLSTPEKHALLDSLMGTAPGDHDNAVLVRKLAERLRRVGLAFPGVEVRWDGLSVEAEVPVSDRTVITLASAGRKMLRALVPGASRASKKPKSILNNVSGVLRPGRMCLLLGPPGSGKTTLLKALAGQVQKSKELKVSGDITYNGLQPGKDFVIERTTAYINQRDEHIAEMTVEETLRFAAECLGSGFSEGLHAEVQRLEQEQGIVPDPDVETFWVSTFTHGRNSVIVDLYARMLGISHVVDTVVGDDLLKGISGGQKRRVTSAEMIVGMTSVLLMDEISNGLDSSSTFQIIKSLKSFAAESQSTLLIGLLQPAPEVFDLFDDVLLMSHGRIVFLGPREEVLPFLAGQGLHCPPSMTPADFLQEVTNPTDQARFWRHPDGKPWSWRSPRQLLAAFKDQPAGQALAARLESPPHTDPLQGLVLHNRPYAQSRMQMLGSVLRREALLLSRNKGFLGQTAGQAAFTGFIVATTFTQMAKDSFYDANLFLSVVFFSVMVMFMGGFNFVPFYCKRLPVVFRQRDHNFYGAWAYAVSSSLLRLPEQLISASVWSLIVYFSCGFTMDAGRFFLFWTNLVMVNSFSSNLFLALGAALRSDVMAQGLGAVALMMFANTCGFTIARQDIPPWFIWLHWFNPMTWTIRAMAINELASPDWDAPATAYDEPDESLGYYTLNVRGFYTSFTWVWLGIVVEAGFSIAAVIGQALALHYLSPRAGAANTTIDNPEDDMDEDELARLYGSKSNYSMRANGGSGYGGPMRGANGGGGSTYSSRAPAAVPLPPTAAAAGAGAVLAPVQLPATTPSSAAAARDVDGSSSVVSSGNSASAVQNGSELQMAVKDGLSARIEVLPDAGLTDGSSRNGKPSTAAAAVAPGGGGGAKEQQQEATVLPVSMSSGLRFEPITLAFRKVAYFVPQPKGKGELQLLDNSSGCFRPGVLTALMGASGAGKTTLMDCLANRKTGGRMEGEQYLNGFPKDAAVFARVAGYVEQFDVHTPQATVEEALMFSARMRLPQEQQQPGTVRPYVHEVMALVELSPLAANMIGSPGSGLSTEQRKRLTIAVELVANPSVVFMDEPTTGLDARAASLVMRAVKNTVRTGRTVVCTIHQPNREIFEAFDELLLLKPGGRIIFNGPVGPDRTRLAHFFGSVPGVEPLLPTYNPAVWMLDVTNPSAEKKLGVDFAELWEASPAAREFGGLVDSLCQPPEGGVQLVFRTAHAQPVHKQFGQLLLRAFTVHWRLPQYNLLRLLVTLFMGVVFGLIYFGIGSNRTTLVDVLNIMGTLYSTAIFLSIFNTLVVIPVVNADRAVYYRERASGMYSALSFSIAQGTAELPYLAAQAMLYSTLIYLLVHFEFTAVKFFWFMLYVFLCLAAFTFYGVMIMNLMPSPMFATSNGGLFLMLWNLFCGFLVYKDDIKPWWIWAYYFNPATWAIYGCITTQLGNVTDEYIDVGGGEMMTIAQYVRDTFSYQYEWRGWVALIIVAITASFRFGSYVGLAKLNFQKR